MPQKSFDLFMNFNGECREAAAFYARVFESEVQGLMRYADMPPDPSFPLAEEDKDRVMYCNVPIFGCNVMLCDSPASMPVTVGDNLSPTLSTTDMEEIRRLYALLLEGGEVNMPLQKTFWSDLYGSVTDRYGVVWQLSHFGEERSAGQ